MLSLYNDSMILAWDLNQMHCLSLGGEQQCLHVHTGMDFTRSSSPLSQLPCNIACSLIKEPALVLWIKASEGCGACFSHSSQKCALHSLLSQMWCQMHNEGTGAVQERLWLLPLWWHVPVLHQHWSSRGSSLTQSFHVAKVVIGDTNHFYMWFHSFTL